MNIQELLQQDWHGWPNLEEETDANIEAEEETEVKEPPLYNVYMHNDDYTPMEFVIAVLENFFSMEREKAVSVMFEAHTNGKATCGTFSKDVAETKTEQAIEYARRHEHPLFCSVEVV